jgi:hypothetical protein
MTYWKLLNVRRQVGLIRDAADKAFTLLDATIIGINEGIAASQARKDEVRSAVENLIDTMHPLRDEPL